MSAHPAQPETADLLLTHAAQLVTPPAGAARRGAQMADLKMMTDAAVAVRDGEIIAVGHTADLAERFTAAQTIDCTGRAIVPGFVDAHTHTVYGGDRVHEFEMRIGGATYMEIMAAGGGIVSTMTHTRQAGEDGLFAAAAERLRQMLHLGSVTVEIKTGYGLDTDTELKMLRVIARLADAHPGLIVPTFLGAHTLPPEYKDNPAGYVDLVVDEMLPAVADWYADSVFAADGIPFFADVFCEDHAFDVAQSRRILTAAAELGLQPKIHVDQFNALGGVEMAVEIGAVSADHLDVTDRDGIQQLAVADTICVPLPAVNFNLAHTQFADARGMIEAGAAVALATDLNPGSAPCYSLPLTMAIATRYQRLLPAEALTAVTLNAAHAVGVGGRVGAVAPGYRADLLVLRPADYRHLTYFLGGDMVETVIAGGRRVPTA